MESMGSILQRMYYNVFPKMTTGRLVVAVDTGHNLPSAGDTGASGLEQEDELNMLVAQGIMKLLRQEGHRVIDCLPKSAKGTSESLQKRCDIANKNNVDLFVSIHFNAFNRIANGTEVFAISSQGRKYAQNILNAILKNFKFVNRGVKNGSHLFVVQNTIAPAVLVECCFCDSERDMALFRVERMAIAIVQGILGRPLAKVKDGVADLEDEVGSLFSIKDLQIKLNQMKFTSKSRHSVELTGTLDDQTLYALNELRRVVGLQKKNKYTFDDDMVVRQIFANRVLKSNHSTGMTVKYLQHRVGADVDGVFGPLTEDSVKKFQALQGIIIDGIVGQITWGKLLAKPIKDVSPLGKDGKNNR